MDQTALDCTGSHYAPSNDWSRSRLDLWHSFCERYHVGEETVPLFECVHSGFVLTKEIEATRCRSILQGSSAMEALMRQEVKKVDEDRKAGLGLCEGTIYWIQIRRS